MRKFLEWMTRRTGLLQVARRVPILLPIINFVDGLSATKFIIRVYAPIIRSGRLLVLQLASDPEGTYALPGGIYTGKNDKGKNITVQRCAALLVWREVRIQIGGGEIIGNWIHEGGNIFFLVFPTIVREGRIVLDRKQFVEAVWLEPNSQEWAKVNVNDAMKEELKNMLRRVQ